MYLSIYLSIFQSIRTNKKQKMYYNKIVVYLVDLNIYPCSYSCAMLEVVVYVWRVCVGREVGEGRQYIGFLPVPYATTTS